MHVKKWAGMICWIFKYLHIPNWAEVLKDGDCWTWCTRNIGSHMRCFILSGPLMQLVQCNLNYTNLNKKMQVKLAIIMPIFQITPKAEIINK